MFPPDVWHIFFSYLSSQQIATYQFISKDLYTITTSYMQRPAFWEPLFNQLSLMPPYHAINPYQHPNHILHTLFKNTLFSIDAEQRNEFLQLKTGDITIPTTLTRHHRTITLSQLQKTHNVLEAINDKNFQTILILIKTGQVLLYGKITRIPYHLKQNQTIMQLVNKHYTKTFNSYYAISHECSPDIIQYYAKLGANINNLNMNKKTCLHLALRNEHFLLIEKLIQCGANINALDNLDRTPLHHYIHHTPHFFEKITFMQFLIKKYGANLNTLDKTGQSPLTTSIAKLYFNTVYSNKNYIETIKFLILEGNININANAYMQGDTLLHLIPRLGPKSGYHMNPHITELISFLIDHCDANINALNSLGETPLISWIKNKAPNDLIFHLITLGAQIHKRDNSGRSAFDEAILEKNKPVANYLYTQENKYEKTFTEQPMPILNAFSNFCQDLQSITNEIEVENQDKKEGPTTSEKNHHHKPL